MSTSADSPVPARGFARDRLEHNDDGLRAARVARIRDLVRSGTYDPPPDDVAEELAAWLVGPVDRRTRVRTRRRA
jgi:hypothetical protein